MSETMLPASAGHGDPAHDEHHEIARLKRYVDHLRSFDAVPNPTATDTDVSMNQQEIMLMDTVISMKEDSKLSSSRAHHNMLPSQVTRNSPGVVMGCGNSPAATSNKQPVGKQALAVAIPSGKAEDNDKEKDNEDDNNDNEHKDEDNDNNTNHGDTNIDAASETQITTNGVSSHDDATLATAVNDDVQPLPMMSRNVDLSPNSEAGAYAVNPFAYTGGSEVLDRNDANVAPITHDFEAPPAPAYSAYANSEDSLVEAHLVEEEDGNNQHEHGPAEVVHAEKLTGEDEHVRRRNRIIQIVVALIIAALIVTLGISLWGGRKNDQDGEEESSSSTLEIQGNHNTSTKAPEVIDDDDAEIDNDAKAGCFGTSEELYQAVTDYWQDPSPSANVSKLHGSIGSWCGLSELAIFNNLFRVSPQRSDYEALTPVNLTDKGLMTATYMSEDIGSWDMRRARRLENMFEGQKNVSATWGIQNWDTPNFFNIRGAFVDTLWTEPKLNLSSWDISNVRTVAELFRDSNVERPGVANWNTQSVKSMYRFADGNPNFNEDLSKWDTQSVTTLQKMFRGCSNFNQDLSAWNTSSNQQLSMTFWGTKSFHSNIGVWDVSNVETLFGTFKESNFNNDITSWDVSKVTDMQQTFQHDQAFNQDIAHWNVSKVTSLRWSFAGASSFSQDLCAWRFTLPEGIPTRGMFQKTSCPNTSDPVSIAEGPFCFNCI